MSNHCPFKIKTFIFYLFSWCLIQWGSDHIWKNCNINEEWTEHVSCGSTKTNGKLSAVGCKKLASSQKKCPRCQAKAQLARDGGFKACGRISSWLTAAICTKQTNFKCICTMPQWMARRPEMCLVNNPVSIFMHASGCEIQLSSHCRRFWGFWFHLFLRNLWAGISTEHFLFFSYRIISWLLEQMILKFSSGTWIISVCLWLQGLNHR